MNNGDVRKLRERFEQMLNEGSRYYFELDELENIADSYERELSFYKGLQVVTHGLEMYPGNEPLLLRKAQYLIMLEQIADAEEILSMITERGVEYYLLCSEIELIRGNDDKALAAFDSIARLADSTIEDCIDILDICSDLNRIELLSRFTTTVESRFEDATPFLRELAMLYELKEDSSEAISLYNKILDVNPFSADDWLSLAKIYARDKVYDKALEACDFAAAIDDKDEGIVAFKGYCLYDSERYSEAIEQFETFLSLTSDKAVAYELLAETYARMERHEDSIKYLLQAIELNDRNHDLYYQLAVNYYYLGSSEQAVQYLRKALACDDSDIEAHVFLGELLLQQEEYNEAYEHLLLADTHPITDLVAAAAFADVCVHLQRYDEALDVLEQLHDKDPYEPHYLFDIILCNMQLGDYEVASNWVKHVEEISNNADVINSLSADMRNSWISIRERIEQLRNILKVYLNEQL